MLLPKITTIFNNFQIQFFNIYKVNLNAERRLVRILSNAKFLCQEFERFHFFLIRSGGVMKNKFINA